MLVMSDDDLWTMLLAFTKFEDRDVAAFKLREYLIFGNIWGHPLADSCQQGERIPERSLTGIFSFASHRMRALVLSLLVSLR